MKLIQVVNAIIAAVACAIALASNNTLAIGVTNTWADWGTSYPSLSEPAPPGGVPYTLFTDISPLAGTLPLASSSTVDLEFTGEFVGWSCIMDATITQNPAFTYSGCPLWSQDGNADFEASAYNNASYVSDISASHEDAIAITGYGGPGVYRIKFSQPVSNLVLPIYSLGNANNTSPAGQARWRFDQPWELVQQSSLCTTSNPVYDTISDAQAPSDKCLARVGTTNTLAGREGDGLLIFPGPLTELSWEVTASEVYAMFNVGFTDQPLLQNVVYIAASDEASEEGAEVQTPTYIVTGLDPSDSLLTEPTCAAYTDLGFGATVSSETPRGRYVTHCAGAEIDNSGSGKSYLVLYKDGTHIVDEVAPHTYVDWTSNSSFNSGSGPGVIGATVTIGNAQGVIDPLLLNGFGTINAAETNYPENWYSPIPESSTEYSFGSIQGPGSNLGSSIDVTVTFNSEITNPRFHFLNLDNNAVTFLDDAGTNLIRRSGNAEFATTGSTINSDDAGTAFLGGCEALDGTNPHGACGTVQINGSYSTISFRVSPVRGTGGDGWAWTVSTPTWTVTPSSDDHSSWSTETAFEVNDDKTFELTLTTDQGYTAVIDGTCPGTDASGVFTSGSITEDCTVTATAILDDADLDTIADSVDNCPNAANTEQADLDGDGAGDLCDGDFDGDGIPNTEDEFGGDPSSPFIQIEGNNPGNCTVDIPATKLNLVGIDAQTAPADPINNKLTFALDCDVGATATVRAFFGEALPPNPAAYKLVEGVWTPIPGAVFDSSNQSVVYQITDGQALDLNGLVDGRIEDPVTVVSLQSDVAPVPLPAWLLAMLAASVSFVGWRHLLTRAQF